MASLLTSQKAIHRLFIEEGLNANFTHNLPTNSLELPVEIRQLPNKMRVALCHMPQLHRACIILNIGAGSRDEQAPGAAHLLEHLIFRGTKKYPSLRLLSEAFESIGADFNAYTSRECTSFDVMLPPQFIARALNLLADAIINARLTGIAGERDIILEEILSDYEDDDSLINAEDLLLESMFSVALGRPIAGSPSQVKALQKADIIDFYQKYYVASNMTLVIAGNLSSTAACFEAANDAFGALALKAVPPKDDYAQLPTPHRALSVKPYQGASQSSVCMAMLGANVRSPDFAASEMLVRILDDGMASRLSRSLVDELALVYDIEAYISMTREYSLLQLRLSCQHRRIGRLLDAIFRIFEDIAQNPPCESELLRAKNRLLWEHSALLDSAVGIAQWLSSALQQGLAPSLKMHAERLLQCSAAEVSKIAQNAVKHWPQRVAVVGDLTKAHAKKICALLEKNGGTSVALDLRVES
jgi:predicted Zn-dependent peptidase